MNIVKNARVTLIILIFITISMIMSASNTHGVEGAPQATSLGMANWFQSSHRMYMNIRFI